MKDTYKTKRKKIKRAELGFEPRTSYNLDIPKQELEDVRIIPASDKD